LWDEFNHSGITGLNILWGFFSCLTSTLVNLGSNELELASDVGSVAIKNWGISILDLTWVVKNDDLSNKHFSVFGWVVL